MKRIVMIATALVLSAFALNAQAQSINKWKLHLGYNIAAPLGSFKNDFIGNTSFRGATGDLIYTFNPTFSLGLSSGFQNYYQKYDRQVYHTQPNQAVSAVVSNNMEVIPLLLKGIFSPMGQTVAFIKPYVSVGAGINLVNYNQYLGEFPSTDGSATLAAQVGVGVLVPFSKSNSETGFKLGATYNYGAYNRNEIKNLNTAAVHAGIVISLK